MESRCKLVGLCFAARWVWTRMTRQDLRRLLSLLLLGWAHHSKVRAAAALTDADMLYVGQPPPMSLWDRVFGVSEADAADYYAWAAEQLERSRKPRRGRNHNISFAWSARVGLSPDRRKLYEMQGADCIENGGGFMPVLKQCKVGCQLPGAYMCIRDMRLNKSMNVPPRCKIDNLHSFRDPNCCPTFDDDNFPETIDRFTSAYPDALKCLESIDCGSSSGKYSMENGIRAAGYKWESNSVVAEDLIDECRSLKCEHRLDCGAQRERNLIKGETRSSAKPTAPWYRCNIFLQHFARTSKSRSMGCEEIAEDPGGHDNNVYCYYLKEDGSCRQMVSVEELLSGVPSDEYGDNPVCTNEEGAYLEPEADAAVKCNKEFKDKICEKTTGYFALKGTKKNPGPPTSRYVGFDKKTVNKCWNLCSGVPPKRMNSTDLLAFINKHKPKQQFACLPTQSGARAPAPAVLAPLLIAAVSLRLMIWD